MVPHRTDLPRMLVCLLEIRRYNIMHDAHSSLDGDMTLHDMHDEATRIPFLRVTY